MLAPSSGDLSQERPHEVIGRAGFAVDKDSCGRKGRQRVLPRTNCRLARAQSAV